MHKMEGEKQHSFKGRLFNRGSLTLSFLIVGFFALTGTLVYLLFQSRTPIARTIWAYFDASNLIVYLAMTFVLLILILWKGKPQLALSLIIVHSVVSHIFKQIVFASRFGYDTWISLGWSVYIFRGEFYPHNPLYPIPFTVYSTWPFLTKIYHITERVNVYSLSVVLAQIFSVDASWTHLLLVPLIWGIFIPILIYRISKFLCKGETSPLLAALLTSGIPSLVMWGSATMSFGLAWVFLLLIVYLSLNYLRFKRGLLLSAIIAFAAFLTHELIGMLSLSIILLAYTYKVIDNIKSKRFRRTLLLMAYVLAVLLIPATLVAFSLYVNPKSGSRFSLDPLYPVTYETFSIALFGEFMDMRFIDVFVHGALTFLGVITLVYMILEGRGERRSRRMNVFMLLCLALIMIDYRFLKLFMINLPFTVERLWVWRDLLAVPYAAIGIGRMMNFLVGRISSGKMALETRLLRKNPVGGFLSAGLRQVVVVLVIVLSLSSLCTSAIFWAYPHYTEAWWTTAYEVDAARYIEENTPINETYAVLSDALGRLAGYAVVGPQNPRAYWYGPYESLLLKPLYSEMVTNPSMGPVLAVRDKNNASIVFVVINKIRTKDADRAIAQIMDLPNSELFGVFGNEVYVFKVRPPLERTIGGVGPSVFLYRNQTYVSFNTTYALDVVTYEASYNLSLSGLSCYNLTLWPDYWSFETITPAPFARDVDANSWINFTGNEDETYTVVWKADNAIYRPVGWKDDSFISEEWQGFKKTDWEILPVVSTDGDILTMTGIFHEGVREGYGLKREVNNISTDEFSYVIVRWKSTGRVAGVLVTYDDDTVTQVLKPDVKWHYGQYSRDWEVSVVKMSEGKTVRSVTLSLDDYPSHLEGYQDFDGMYRVYYDYIMFTSVSPPQS